jgi:hypothetical protein
MLKFSFNIKQKTQRLALLSVGREAKSARHVELVHAVVLHDPWGMVCPALPVACLIMNYPVPILRRSRDCHDMPQKMLFSRRVINMIYGFVTLTKIAADFDSPLSQKVGMGVTRNTATTYIASRCTGLRSSLFTRCAAMEIYARKPWLQLQVNNL